MVVEIEGQDHHALHLLHQRKQFAGGEGGEAVIQKPIRHIIFQRGGIAGRYIPVALGSPVLVLQQLPLPCGAVILQLGILGLTRFEKRKNRIAPVMAAGIFRKQQILQEITGFLKIVLFTQRVAPMPADHFPQAVVVLTGIQGHIVIHDK